LKPDAWDKGSEFLESANKLNVLYVFENKAYLTDAFKETMKLVITDKSIKKGLQGILEDYDGNDDDFLLNYTSALVFIHITRLGIPYIDDDLHRCVLMLHAHFELKDEKMDGLFSLMLRARARYQPT